VYGNEDMERNVEIVLGHIACKVGRIEGNKMGKINRRSCRKVELGFWDR
jgi:hypothetical protein